MRGWIATRKGLFVAERLRGGWRVSEPRFLGAAVDCVDRDPRDGTVWAGLHHGHWGPKLHVSTDGGVTFAERACPAFPAGTAAEGRPVSVRRLLALSFPGPAGTVRVGTDPGGLFGTRDGGYDWELDEALWRRRIEDGWFPSGGGLMLHSVEESEDGERAFVGVSCAGVYVSTDGGSSWTPRNAGVPADYLPERFPETGQDAHRLRWSAAHPDTLWQTNHCGVFVSRDAGASWRDVSAGLPTRHAFPLAVDGSDPDRAWVVPHESDARRVVPGGALVVARTDDGGATWIDLRDGLPQRDCWDLVFRHGLDARGGALLLGTTAGRVYAGTRAGDAWEALDAVFPPVHAVRIDHA